MNPVSQGTTTSPTALAKLVGCSSVMRRAAHLFHQFTALAFMHSLAGRGVSLPVMMAAKRRELIRQTTEHN
jgi:hypothetical protein